MSGSGTKEQRRNMRKAFGPEIEDALAELRVLVQNVHNEHRVLAKQMHDFERIASTLKEGRSWDQNKHTQLGARVDELLERVEAQDLRLASTVLRLDRAEAILLHVDARASGLCDRIGTLEQRAQLPWWRRLRRVRRPLEMPIDGVEVIRRPSAAQVEQFFNDRTY